MGARESLTAYRRKRDFAKTPEPEAGGRRSAGSALSFVVQEHHASHLHYDFRLELDGTLKSWAVPKGPSLDPKIKRMAVQVEDHPLSYGRFEGTIPPGQYGAGTVSIWDRGQWLPEGDARQGLAEGKLKFELRGERLRGRWMLVRMHGNDEKKPPWLLIKERDDTAPGEAPSRAARQPARKAVALPATLAPQLATLATSAPATPADWLYELKFDGYRLLTRIDSKGVVRCFTRNGHDWTAKLPTLARALGQLGVRSAWLDGEVVVEGKSGAPDFQALQNAFDSGTTSTLVYWLFDLPFVDGEDLRSLPLEQRRARLQALWTPDTPAALRFSEAFDAPPRDLLASAARLGFEGIVGKRKGSSYVSRRSPDWIKLKHQQRQEFVIGGYTAPRGSRSGFGALLLGVYDGDGALRYCGNVGTGFDAARLADIQKRLARLATPRSPFADLPASVRAQAVKPTLVAEVSFGEWTREGRVRHASFQGLRDDKPARQIVREEAPQPPIHPMRKAKEELPLTHAERVVDPQSGLTKGDVAAWYRDVATLMLPHLRGRPVSLVRAPEGIAGELFFQKHAQGHELPGVRLLDASLDAGHAPLLQIDTAVGLRSAARMNVIELHTWNACSAKIATPDRMTFDLDPGEGVDWAQVQEGALLVQTMLAELGLPAFLKTSGGKGLHVVVPLRPQFGWEAVKGFSKAMVQHLADTIPERFVARSGPRNRVGRIFVDYLRNGFGATTVSAWSVRARPGLGVSVPVAWDELPTLRSGDHWTLATVRERLAVGNRPWAQMTRHRGALGSAIKKFGYAAPAGRA